MKVTVLAMCCALFCIASAAEKAASADAGDAKKATQAADEKKGAAKKAGDAKAAGDKKADAKAAGDKKGDAKAAGDKKVEEKKGDAKADPALTPEQQAAADAKREKELQLLIKTRKPMYSHYADVLKVSTALHKPVLLVMIGKGTPAEGMIKKLLFRNKLFMTDFAMKNFVIYKMELKYGPSKENPRAKEVQTRKLKKEDQKLLELVFGEDPIKTPFVAVLNETMTETVFNTQGFITEMPQITKDLPMQTWLETLATLMAAKKYELEISPAVRKYIETPPKEKVSKKKGK